MSTATATTAISGSAVRPVFGEYSKYYDLLYSDKNYQQEADYVCAFLEEHPGRRAEVLEFGSGTGRHGRLLAARGLNVVGIERSPEMARQANSFDEVSGSGSFRCVVGDLCSALLDRKFDCVLALFHVISYQTSDAAVESAFTNAARHLEQGGVFVFDVWHAPAVLCERPVVRVKRVEDARFRLTRIAEPTLLTEENCVSVNYTLFVEDKLLGQTGVCEEQHLMRYFSLPELRSIAVRTGFELVHSEEWLSRKSPGPDTWGVCYVLRKTGA